MMRRMRVREQERAGARDSHLLCQQHATAPAPPRMTVPATDANTIMASKRRGYREEHEKGNGREQEQISLDEEHGDRVFNLELLGPIVLERILVSRLFVPLTASPIVHGRSLCCASASSSPAQHVTFVLGTEAFEAPVKYFGDAMSSPVSTCHSGLSAKERRHGESRNYRHVAGWKESRSSI
eukprot:753225-Hanusia_phi.AAC.4